MATDARAALNAVDPLFLERWSPRAFDGSPIPQTDLETLFDAARWAPSAFNAQPWRFVYAHRDGPDWPRFLDILLPFNSAWAAQASALVFILSDTLTTFPNGEERPNGSHSFDSGAAWALLALQAIRLGYHSHGIGGFDRERARIELRVPERFRIEMALAVGRRAEKSVLTEALQAREQPSGRKELTEFVFAGIFSE
jgi:nitroreductase